MFEKFGHDFYINFIKDDRYTWLLDGLKTTLIITVFALIIGLIISIFQTITSIQEQTLTFVPKFIAVMAVLVLAGGWMLNDMTSLFVDLVKSIPQYIK